MKKEINGIKQLNKIGKSWFILYKYWETEDKSCL